ncbi:MAG TPA: AI-2E family transporter [Pyrinomonadaceae bacterium]|jgi:predicted PurR-regulated permease PerM|nr:AI-2E family transporter [Pyrinomonadaceae bacterium]
MSNDDSRQLKDLTIGEAKRVVVYGVVLVLAVGLFLLLVGQVLVALLLGLVAGAFLLPVQEWLERRLRARSGSALITIALIVVPLVLLAGYAWHELSGYSTNISQQERTKISDAISGALERYIPVSRAGTRATLEAAFTEGLTRSAAAIQDLRSRAALILASLTVFLFTVFYVLTHRKQISNYIKVRVPGDYIELYERLAENVGGALRGALQAVFIDQFLKAVIIFVLNLVFGIPLALVLAIITFLTGFFPLLGEWAIYVPVSVYLLVFRNDPVGASVYLVIGIMMTIGSSLLLRPRVAASGAGRFNFYWMFLALIAGVYTFGIPGIVLGPAIIGFVKAISDTLVGQVRYETSLLKEEKVQQAEQQQEERLKRRVAG